MAKDSYQGAKLGNLSAEIIGRLASLYPRLATVEDTECPELSEFESPRLEMPTLEALAVRVEGCSFNVFSDAKAYAECKLAKKQVIWVAPREDSYRVFFDTQSETIHVDLNAVLWDGIRSQAEAELFYCDLLRTLIWVLTCEVERYELEKQAESGDASGGAIPKA